MRSTSSFFCSVGHLQRTCSWKLITWTWDDQAGLHSHLSAFRSTTGSCQKSPSKTMQGSCSAYFHKARMCSKCPAVSMETSSMITRSYCVKMDAASCRSRCKRKAPWLVSTSMLGWMARISAASCPVGRPNRMRAPLALQCLMASWMTKVLPVPGGPLANSILCPSASCAHASSASSSSASAARMAFSNCLFIALDKRFWEWVSLTSLLLPAAPSSASSSSSEGKISVTGISPDR